MSDGFERLRQEASALASAPILAAVALVVALVAIWAALHWSYQLALSSRDTRIVFLERRLAEYRDRLGAASPDEIRKRIDALETELRTLRVRLQPRRLTPAQRQAIIDRSRLPSGAKPAAVVVAYEGTCSDCRAFAEDLLGALGEHGNWQTTATVIEGPAERPRTGLGIRIEQPLRPQPDAVRLQAALRSAGMPFDMVPGPAGAGIELLVTERAAQ
jgi:hypothetical protein